MHSNHSLLEANPVILQEEFHITTRLNETRILWIAAVVIRLHVFLDRGNIFFDNIFDFFHGHICAIFERSSFEIRSLKFLAFQAEFISLLKHFLYGLMLDYWIKEFIVGHFLQDFRCLRKEILSCFEWI
jgi:hypothetical protein